MDDDLRPAPAGMLSLPPATLTRRRIATQWHEEHASPTPGNAPRPESLPKTEIHLVLAGHGHLHRPTKPTLPLGPGDIVLTRRGVAKNMALPGAERCLETIAATYDASTLFRSSAKNIDALHIAADRVMDQAGLLSVVHLIRNELARGHDSSLLLRRLFDVLFLTVVRDCESSDSAGRMSACVDIRVQRVVNALRSHLGERWNVAKMAKLAGMSRAAFIRRFTKTTGHAPLAYLTRLRMDHARRRLAESDDNVTEIAEEVGYESVYAFSRAFKRAVGIAPRFFRRRARAAFTPTGVMTTMRLAA